MQSAIRIAIVTLSLLAAGVAAQSEVVTELKLGIDRTRVRADKVKLDATELSEALDRRVTLLVERGGTVEVKGMDEIHVRVPLERLTPAQERLLTRPGRLEIRHLDDVQTNLNPDGKYVIDVLTVQGKSELRFRDRGTNMPVESQRLVAKSPLLFDNDDLAANGAQVMANGAIVRVKLTEKATKRLETFLKKPGRMIAVVLDDEIVSITGAVTTVAPKQKSKGKKKPDEAVIVPGQPDPPAKEEGGAQVDLPGGFRNPEEAAILANILNAGPLPFPLTIRSRQVVAR